MAAAYRADADSRCPWPTPTGGAKRVAEADVYSVLPYIIAPSACGAALVADWAWRMAAGDRGPSLQLAAWHALEALTPRGRAFGVAGVSPAKVLVDIFAAMAVVRLRAALQHSRRLPRWAARVLCYGP